MKEVSDDLELRLAQLTWYGDQVARRFLKQISDFDYDYHTEVKEPIQDQLFDGGAQ